VCSWKRGRRGYISAAYLLERSWCELARECERNERMEVRQKTYTRDDLKANCRRRVSLTAREWKHILDGVSTGWQTIDSASASRNVCCHAVEKFSFFTLCATISGVAVRALGQDAVKGSNIIVGPMESSDDEWRGLLSWCQSLALVHAPSRSIWRGRRSTTLTGVRQRTVTRGKRQPLSSRHAPVSFQHCRLEAFCSLARRGLREGCENARRVVELCDGMC
jgi:hypothetical protein